ncbi:hypothetical protein PAXINDRAFT_136955 [Paxillus involutus ATCC 200175]|uniref:BTB domain-containing protein n=1 Tax=Paxillus involutus ATCC 200175 TaxID=664439 RepID=A0A0C9TA73_PAXIN|nr:hypothetical protein PAXINDRAFT_136955 [Paxillus involutus ATCC 200175]
MASSRHERFYMTNVTLLVEDCLLRVPRDPLQSQSPVFRDMFLLPVGDQGEAEGLSDAKPIRLEGVKLDDFEQLLKVLYPGSHGKQELPDGCAQWTSVLKLASLWDFDGVREKAIEALEALDITPVDKVALAMQYNIEKWMIPAINAMAQRPEPIGVEDVDRLGLDAALKIARIREQVFLRTVYSPASMSNKQELRPGHRDPTTQKLDFTPTICTTFGLLAPS